MQPISRNAFTAPAPPYLQNPQGWQFFFEAEEVEPGLWIGIVRIHTGSTGLTCRQCNNTGRLCSEHEGHWKR